MTSEQLMLQVQPSRDEASNLSSYHYHIASLKVPIAEAESDFEMHENEDDDEDDDEDYDEDDDMEEQLLQVKSCVSGFVTELYLVAFIFSVEK